MFIVTIFFLSSLCTGLPRQPVASPLSRMADRRAVAGKAGYRGARNGRRDSALENPVQEGDDGVEERPELRQEDQQQREREQQ